MSGILRVNSQADGVMSLTTPIPRFTYLRALMRANSFPWLLERFKCAQDPVKEFTESYAALHHLRPWQRHQCIVLHIGDGAHARTAALFALMSKHVNVAVDPLINVAAVNSWRLKHDVARFMWAETKVEDFELDWWVEQALLSNRKLLFTFVHAHVDVDSVLRRVPREAWWAAYTNSCCFPSMQLGTGGEVKEDWAILSPKRQFKVLTPRNWGAQNGTHSNHHV